VYSFCKLCKDISNRKAAQHNNAMGHKRNENADAGFGTLNFTEVNNFITNEV